MTFTTKIKLIVFLLSPLIILVPGSMRAEAHLIPDLVSDTMPTAIRIRLDNIALCIQRNQYRSVGDQLICNPSNPQLDPDTYTMDQYVIGVLKAEVGPTAYIPAWHVEALKAIAVAARTYGWSNMTERGDGSYEIGCTTSVQAFFPEKPVDDEQKYSDAGTLTGG